jgi:hypothetical protein
MTGTLAQEVIDLFPVGGQPSLLQLWGRSGEWVMPFKRVQLIVLNADDQGIVRGDFLVGGRKCQVPKEWIKDAVSLIEFLLYVTPADHDSIFPDGQLFDLMDEVFVFLS